MRFLQVFLNWWARDLRSNRTPSSMNNAAPRDHFDKAGQYVFKDKQLGKLAKLAAALGLVMTLTTVNWTGAVQTFTVPAGVTTLTLTLNGAGGAYALTSAGGSGSQLTGSLTVTPGQVLTICVGAGGIKNPSTGETGAAGGCLTQAYGGGGWTGVFNSGGTLLALAGGGGAEGTYYSIAGGAGGNGGGLTGAVGGNAPSGATGGGGGTQTTGGAAGGPGGAAGSATHPTATGANGVGGTGMFSSPYYFGGGGGGGYCGAGGGGGYAGGTTSAGGGGGSDFIPAGWTSTQGGGSGATVNGSVVLSYPSGPNAPTILTPVNGSTLDVSSGLTPTATYNSTDGYSQNAYACRVKVSGGAYSFFNAGAGTLVGSIVWNSISTAPGANFSVPIPSGLLTNGHTYNLSIASQESGSGLQGSFATDITFIAQAAPTVNVTAPVGTVTGSTQPTVVWTDTLPGSAIQTAYQIWVETGAYGNSPGLGTSVWSSGLVSSALTSIMVATPLAVQSTYRVFVQITETGGQTSPLGGSSSYSTFTVAADVPALPTIVAVNYNDPTSGLPEVQLQIQANDNQLTLNQASLESGATTGWTAGANTSITASTTWTLDGSYSLRMGATAAGAVSVTTPTGVSGVVVAAGETVRALASFHSPTTPRVCNVAIAFYNSTGTLLSTVTSSNVNSSTTVGTQAFVTTTAPAGAAFMTIILNGAGLGIGEFLYSDCHLLGPGSTSTWTTGGFVGVTTLTVVRSDGMLVRGVGWIGSASLPTFQALVVYDTETPPYQPFTYTATVTAVVAGLTYTSAPATSAAVTVSPTHWDISDPNNISTGTKIEWFGDNRTFDQPETQGVFSALGRKTNIVVRGDLQAETPTQLVLQFGGDADAAWTAFKALRNQQVTLMLRGDMPGDFYYVALGSSRPMVLLRTSNRQADPSRTLTISVAVVDRP